MPKYLLGFIFFLSLSINVYAENDKEVLYDAIPSARYFDESYQIMLPWDGYNTKSLIYTPIPDELIKRNQVVIKHPADYSLFVDGRLYYRSLEKDSIIFSGAEISDLSRKDTIWLTHQASMLNKDRLGTWLVREDLKYAPAVLAKKGNDSTEKLTYFFHLILFVLFAVVRTISKREFDFYFSGAFIRSPRLNLEKFMGDSLNPFLIFLGAVTLSFILSQNVGLPNYLDYQILNLGFVNTNSDLFAFVVILLGTILYLLLKRTMYLVFLWMKQELRDFSGVWRSYLLSFTNLTFWFFLIYSIPILLFPNFELGKFFQIIFFIFAALNAGGGMMVYSNFRIKSNLITISGILAIDIFPIILLVQIITF